MSNPDFLPQLPPDPDRTGLDPSVVEWLDNADQTLGFSENAVAHQAPDARAAEVILSAEHKEAVHEMVRLALGLGSEIDLDKPGDLAAVLKPAMPQIPSASASSGIHKGLKEHRFKKADQRLDDLKANSPGFGSGQRIQRTLPNSRRGYLGRP